MKTKDKAVGSRDTRHCTKANTAWECFKLGLHQYTCNLKKTITVLWPFALFSAACSAGILCLLFKLVKEQNTTGHLLTASITIAILAVLTILSELYMYTGCFRQATEGVIHDRTWKCARLFLRVCKLVLYLLSLQLIPIAVAIGGHLFFHGSSITDQASVPFAKVLTVIVIIIVEMLYLPVVYIAIKFLLEKKSNLFYLLYKHYRPSLRHYGLIFAVVLLSTILVGLSCWLVTLPCQVLVLACGQAANDYALGDTVTFPGYFTALMFVAGTLTFFLANYVKSSVVYIIAVLYGTIDAKRLRQEEK